MNLDSIRENFFIIDSDYLEGVKTRLYGYCISENYGICEDIDFKENIKLNGLGAYVYVERMENEIVIKQDFNGSFGLYIYKKNDGFVLSNSFVYLIEYLCSNAQLSVNKDYANWFLVCDLCSMAMEETLINEITWVERNVELSIDVEKKRLKKKFIDYKENSVDINTHEGISILDSWMHRWTKIMHLIKQETNNIRIDLSGGFDSRLSFLLLLKSGININDILVYSIKDELHTHKEDYEIASKIADFYGFRLNDFSNIVKNKIPYTLEQQIAISAYVKFGFHKQMYWKAYKHINRYYMIVGSGGECIRSYWNKQIETYKEEQLRRTNSFAYNTKKIMNDSILRLLTSSVESVCKKFDIKDLESFEILQNWYREARCRNHFGRANVENYLSNMFTINPLMDPQLHKLKINDNNCDDKNLLMALIFVRYEEPLLKFRFEGDRKIAESTISYAKKINEHFPVNKISIDKKIEKKVRKYEKIDNIPQKIISREEVDSFIKKCFDSYEVKNILEYEFGNGVYDYIVKDIEKRNFYPLSNVYAAMSIVNAIVNCNMFSNRNLLSFMKKLEKQSTNVNIINNHASEIMKKIMTARIDIKNYSIMGRNDILFVKISDNCAQISSPKWFSKEGNGYVLESFDGKIDIFFKCIGSGDLNICLCGKDERKSDGSKKPQWVDYTKLWINGIEIFNELMPVWHDKPYKYSTQVNDGDIVFLHVEWEPHLKRDY